MGNLKSQFNLGNIIALLGLLFTMGFFTHIGSGIDGYIAQAAMNSPQFWAAVDSVATMKVDSSLDGGAAEKAIERLAALVDTANAEQMIETLHANNEWATQLKTSFDEMGVKPEDIVRNHKLVKQMASYGIPLGPFLDDTGAFMFRWPSEYESRVDNRLYGNYTHPVPTHIGPDGKTYIIPSMINNL